MAFASLGSWSPPAAHADDRVPTAWQEQAGTAPLLTAPAPPDPATICIIDTGVTPTPDLDIVARTSLLGDPLDDVRASATNPGHGTVVAHFAAGRVNGWGGAGAFPHAKIASVRIFPAEGGAVWDDYVAALDQCRFAAPTTRVVLMSLGGQSIQDAARAELENRIIQMRNTRGINVVVAAGNGGGETDFPGRFPASFTITGLDGAGNLCPFSARGENIDLAAPGCGLEQAGWTGSRWSMDGTSFAVPIVAGAIAALRSYRPDLSASQVERILLDTAKPGRFPELDTSAALRAIGLGDLVPPVAADSPSSTEREPQLASRPATPARETKPEVTLSGSVSPARTRRVTRLTRSRLRRPKIRQSRPANGVVILRATNRPAGAVLEIEIGHRRRQIQSGRTRLRSGRVRRMRARYVTDLVTSEWTTVSILSH